MTTIGTNARLPPRFALARHVMRREIWVAMLLLITAIVAGSRNSNFFSWQNARDILHDAAPTVIVACPMTLVIVTGEIDISVGSLLGLMAAAMGILASIDHLNWGAAPAAAAVLALGTLIGLTNGLLVTVGRVPSIIVTLGMLTALRGLTQLIMQGRSIRGIPLSLRWFGQAAPLGIPLAVWAAMVVTAFCILLAHRTPLGRRIYAAGSNPKAAPLAGLSLTRIKLFVFFLNGLLTGVAAIVSVPRSAVIENNVGDGFELLVVTCAVVGGTSISGGAGTIIGSAIAAVLLTMIGTVLIYLDVNPHWNQAIQGAFILAAVLADHLLRHGGGGGAS